MSVTTATDATSSNSSTALYRMPPGGTVGVVTVAVRSPVMLHAVAALIEFEFGATDFVVRICREVIDNPAIGWATWVEANRLIAQVLPGSLERRRKGLRSLLTDDESPVHHQLWAAEQLIHLDGGGDRMTALAFLRSVEDRKGISAADKRAARELISKAPPVPS